MPWDNKKFLNATLGCSSDVCELWLECGPWKIVPHDDQFRDVIGEFGLRILTRKEFTEAELGKVDATAEILATIRNEQVKLVLTYVEGRFSQRFPVKSFQSDRKRTTLFGHREEVLSRLSHLESRQGDALRSAFSSSPLDRWLLLYIEQNWPDHVLDLDLLRLAVDAVYPPRKVTALEPAPPELLVID